MRIDYAAEHEPAARRALVLMQSRLAELGGPMSVESRDGVIFWYRIEGLHRSGGVGDHLFEVDTATGEVRGQPRF